MGNYSLVEHRNGRLYALINSAAPLTDQQRNAIAREISQDTGRQVLGLRSTIPTRSTPGPGANYNLLMTGFRTPSAIGAMRSSIAALGDTSPSLRHDSYVLGKFPHLLYTERVQLLEVTEPRSEAESKVHEAIERSYKYMPGEVAARARQIFTAENIALIAGTMAVYGIAHVFGVGFILDVILAIVALVAVGTLAVDAFLKFIEFYKKATNASSEAELEDAAKLFAEVVLTIGIGATTAILTRRQLSAAGRREMDQAVANRAMSRTGGPAPRQRSIEEIRGRVIQLRGNIELFGPGAKQPGRALNLTNDNAFVLSKDWDDVFFVAAHATENSMSFYADISGTVSIGARALAVQMFKAGYRGGDVVLLACEAGLNRGLVRGVHKELSALGLSRPVGAIHAPRRAIIGAETVRPHPELGWAAWESYSFN